MKKRTFWQGVLTLALLIPALLIGFFLPAAAARWQDRQLESKVTTFDAQPVSLQLIPELNASEKLRLAGGSYSAIYNGITGTTPESIIIQHAYDFLKKMDAFGFGVTDIEEALATPFLAISADDSAMAAIFWSVNLYCSPGLNIHLIIDDETRSVLAFSEDVTDYYGQVYEGKADASTFSDNVDLYGFAAMFAEILAQELGFVGATVEDPEIIDSGAVCAILLLGAVDEDDVVVFTRVSQMTVSCNE